MTGAATTRVLPRLGSLPVAGLPLPPLGLLVAPSSHALRVGTGPVVG